MQVAATIQEFIPSADPPSPPATELITPSVVLLSSGNPLPAADSYHRSRDHAGFGDGESAGLA